MKRTSKILFVFIIAIICLLVVLLILPFVINLNKFKPQIQDAVSKQINAKIDFSSIQLTILSGLGFRLEDVSLVNTNNQFKNSKILQVKELQFKTRLLPILTGNIQGNIEIDSPNITILKDGDANNISSLVKAETSQENKNSSTKFTLPSDKQQAANPSSTESKNAVPEKRASKTPQQTKKHEQKNESNFTKNILIESFIIKNADIAYLDTRNKNDSILIHKLNVDISNIGLDKEMQVILSSNLDLTNDDYKLKGPIALKIIAKTAMESSSWKDSSFKGEFNLDKVDINYKNVFVKSGNLPFHFSFTGNATPQSIFINNLELTLQSIGMRADVTIHDFNKLDSVINLNLFSKDVSSLSEIFPPYKSLLSSGNFNLTSNIHGLLSDKRAINSSTKLAADMYKSDIQLSLNESSLEPLKGNIQAKSKDFNLGEILKPLQSSSDKNKKNNSPAINYDDLKLHNFSTNTSIENNIMNVKELNLDIFNGRMTSSVVANLTQNPVSYIGNMNLQHIQIQDLIKVIQVNSNRESPIEGSADIIFNYNRKGYTREELSKTLNVKGHYKFYTGKLNIKSIIGLASDQLTKYVSNINVPGLNAGLSKINGIDLGKDKQKDLKNTSGNFEIKNGKIILDNNITSDQGDIKLNATVGLDESLGGTALYTSKKSVTDQLVAQDKNFSYLLDSHGDLQLHLILGGTLSEPNVKIDPKNLTENVLKNTSQALRKQIKDTVEEKIKNNPEAKKIEDSAKKLLKDKGLDLDKLGF